MVSYNVTYDDYAGKKRTETHYFDLTRTEINMLNARYGGSLEQTLARLTMTENAREMMDILMDVFKTAYGRMDDDRVHFRKSPEIWDDFASTPAFDKLFMETMSSDEKSAAFMRGVLPPKAAEAVDNGDAAARIAELQSADVIVS